MIKYCTFLVALLILVLQPVIAQEHNSGAHAKHSYGSKGYADSINSGLIPKDTLKASVHRTTMLTIGGCHLHIEYGSPGVRGRVIWGGLVPYDEVWSTGAHNASSLNINRTVRFGGKTIAPGTYAIFTIPGKETWTFILNKNANQHLADDYKQAEDLVRISVKPASVSMTQRLTYSIVETGKKSGQLVISWEKLSITIPFDVL